MEETAMEVVPEFTKPLGEYTFKVNGRGKLSVALQSASEYKVSWFRNGKRLDPSADPRFHYAIENNAHSLNFLQVHLEDEGKWTCVAENVVGKQASHGLVRLMIPRAYKPPEFVEPLRAILTDAGTVSLECKVTGVPTPLLQWFKDGESIKPGDVFALKQADPTSLGSYTCQATNCMGTAVSCSHVHVTSSRPVITDGLVDHKARIGEPHVLTVGVRNPIGKVTWYNKGVEVKEDHRISMVQNDFSVELVLNPLMLSDDGEWKCSVNGVDTTCFVSVVAPKNYRKPRFLQDLKAVLTEEGLVTFECKVVGYPTPELKWFKDGVELKPGDVYQLCGSNSLGLYTCIASNCMGVSESTAELTFDDIQFQLSEEERGKLIEHLSSVNRPPQFVRGLKSTTVLVGSKLEITVELNCKATLEWYFDNQLIQPGGDFTILGNSLIAETLNIGKEGEYKCVAKNEYGTSFSCCRISLNVPNNYKKPRFLEGLRAVLHEGIVNLECKVIGVPQPTLKWFKDGIELKAGDIHKIVSSGGNCCLGTYTCQARNCMGACESSASLLGFEENKKQEDILEKLARDPSLSTILEERSSQMVSIYETAEGLDEISVSIDGKEVSVSLYETPDLTEQDAKNIIEMFADEFSEYISEHNVFTLPSLRFVKETTHSGRLVMEAMVIDVDPEGFETAPSRHDSGSEQTEADFEDITDLSESRQSMVLEDYEAVQVGAAVELVLEKERTMTSLESPTDFNTVVSDGLKILELPENDDFRVIEPDDNSSSPEISFYSEGVDTPVFGSLEELPHKIEDDWEMVDNRGLSEEFNETINQFGGKINEFLNELNKLTGSEPDQINIFDSQELEPAQVIIEDIEEDIQISQDVSDKLREAKAKERKDSMTQTINKKTSGAEPNKASSEVENQKDTGDVCDTYGFEIIQHSDIIDETQPINQVTGEETTKAINSEADPTLPSSPDKKTKDAPGSLPPSKTAPTQENEHTSIKIADNEIVGTADESKSEHQQKPANHSDTPQDRLQDDDSKNNQLEKQQKSLKQGTTLPADQISTSDAGDALSKDKLTTLSQTEAQNASQATSVLATAETDSKEQKLKRASELGAQGAATEFAEATSLVESSTEKALVTSENATAEQLAGATQAQVLQNAQSLLETSDALSVQQLSATTNQAATAESKTETIEKDALQIQSLASLQSQQLMESNQLIEGAVKEAAVEVLQQKLDGLEVANQSAVQSLAQISQLSETAQAEKINVLEQVERAAETESKSLKGEAEKLKSALSLELQIEVAQAEERMTAGGTVVSASEIETQELDKSSVTAVDVQQAQAGTPRQSLDGLQVAESISIKTPEGAVIALTQKQTDETALATSHSTIQEQGQASETVVLTSETSPTRAEAAVNSQGLQGPQEEVKSSAQLLLELDLARQGKVASTGNESQDKLQITSATATLANSEGIADTSEQLQALQNLERDEQTAKAALVADLSTGISSTSALTLKNAAESSDKDIARETALESSEELHRAQTSAQTISLCKEDVQAMDILSEQARSQMVEGVQGAQAQQLTQGVDTARATSGGQLVQHAEISGEIEGNALQAQQLQLATGDQAQQLQFAAGDQAQQLQIATGDQAQQQQMNEGDQAQRLKLAEANQAQQATQQAQSQLQNVSSEDVTILQNLANAENIEAKQVENGFSHAHITEVTTEETVQTEGSQLESKAAQIQSASNESVITEAQQIVEDASQLQEQKQKKISATQSESEQLQVAAVTSVSTEENVAQQVSQSESASVTSTVEDSQIKITATKTLSETSETVEFLSGTADEKQQASKSEVSDAKTAAMTQQVASQQNGVVAEECGGLLTTKEASVEVTSTGDLTRANAQQVATILQETVEGESAEAKSVESNQAKAEEKVEGGMSSAATKDKQEVLVAAAEQSGDNKDTLDAQQKDEAQMKESRKSSVDEKLVDESDESKSKTKRKKSKSSSPEKDKKGVKKASSQEDQKLETTEDGVRTSPEKSTQKSVDESTEKDIEKVTQNEDEKAKQDRYSADKSPQVGSEETLVAGQGKSAEDVANQNAEGAKKGQEATPTNKESENVGTENVEDELATEAGQTAATLKAKWDSSIDETQQNVTVKMRSQKPDQESEKTDNDEQSLEKEAEPKDKTAEPKLKKKKSVDGKSQEADEEAKTVGESSKVSQSEEEKSAANVDEAEKKEGSKRRKSEGTASGKSADGVADKASDRVVDEAVEQVTNQGLSQNLEDLELGKVVPGKDSNEETSARAKETDANGEALGTAKSTAVKVEEGQTVGKDDVGEPTATKEQTSTLAEKTETTKETDGKPADKTKDTTVKDIDKSKGKSEQESEKQKDESEQKETTKSDKTDDSDDKLKDKRASITDGDKTEAEAAENESIKSTTEELQVGTDSTLRSKAEVTDADKASEATASESKSKSKDEAGITNDEAIDETTTANVEQAKKIHEPKEDEGVKKTNETEISKSSDSAKELAEDSAKGKSSDKKSKSDEEPVTEDKAKKGSVKKTASKEGSPTGEKVKSKEGSPTGEKAKAKDASAAGEKSKSKEGSPTDEKTKSTERLPTGEQAKLKEGSPTSEKAKSKDASQTDEKAKSKEGSPTGEKAKSKEGSPTSEKAKSKDASQTDEKAKSKEGSPTGEKAKTKDASQTGEKVKSKEESPTSVKAKSKEESPTGEKAKSKEASPTKEKAKSKEGSPVGEKAKSKEGSPVGEKAKAKEGSPPGKKASDIKSADDETQKELLAAGEDEQKSQETLTEKEKLDSKRKTSGAGAEKNKQKSKESTPEKLSAKDVKTEEKDENTTTTKKTEEAETSEKKAKDTEVSDKQTESAKSAADKKAEEDMAAGIKAGEAEGADKKAGDAKTTDQKAEDVKSSEKQAEDAKSLDKQAEDAKPTDKQAEDAKPTDKKTEEAETVNDAAKAKSVDKKAETKPGDEKPDEAKETDKKVDEASPEGDKSKRKKSTSGAPEKTARKKSLKKATSQDKEERTKLETDDKASADDKQLTETTEKSEKTTAQQAEDGKSPSESKTDDTKTADLTKDAAGLEKPSGDEKEKSAQGKEEEAPPKAPERRKKLKDAAEKKNKSEEKPESGQADDKAASQKQDSTQEQKVDVTDAGKLETAEEQTVETLDVLKLETANIEKLESAETEKLGRKESSSTETANAEQVEQTGVEKSSANETQADVLDANVLSHGSKRDKKKIISLKSATELKTQASIEIEDQASEAVVTKPDEASQDIVDSEKKGLVDSEKKEVESDKTKGVDSEEKERVDSKKKESVDDSEKKAVDSEEKAGDSKKKGVVDLEKKENADTGKKEDISSDQKSSGDSGKTTLDDQVDQKLRDGDQAEVLKQKDSQAVVGAEEITGATTTEDGKKVINVQLKKIKPGSLASFDETTGAVEVTDAANKAGTAEKSAIAEEAKLSESIDETKTKQSEAGKETAEISTTKDSSVKSEEVQSVEGTKSAEPGATQTPEEKQEEAPVAKPRKKSRAGSESEKTKSNGEAETKKKSSAKSRKGSKSDSPTKEASPSEIKSVEGSTTQNEDKKGVSTTEVQPDVSKTDAEQPSKSGADKDAKMEGQPESTENAEELGTGKFIDIKKIKPKSTKVSKIELQSIELVGTKEKGKATKGDAKEAKSESKKDQQGKTGEADVGTKAEDKELADVKTKAKKDSEADEAKTKDEKAALEKKTKKDTALEEEKAKHEEESAEKKAAGNKGAIEAKETDNKAKSEKEAEEKAKDEKKQQDEKQITETKEKKEKEAIEEKAKEEKEEAEKKLKEENEAAEKKAKGKKEKESAEKKAEEEKVATEKKAKEEKEVKEKQEKEAADKKVKEKTEKEAAEKKAKEKEAAEKKAKEENEAKEKEAADKKEKEAKEKKDKEAAEKKEKEAKENKEKEAKEKKDKEAAEKKEKEAKEKKDKEAAEKKEKEAKEKKEKEAKEKKDKEAAEKKEKEAKEKKEKEAKEKKDKEAAEKKEKEAKEKKDKEAAEKKEKEEKEKKDKEAAEIKEKEAKEKEAADKKAKEEKEAAEKKAKEEKEATEKKEKEVADKKAKEKKEKKEKEAAEKKAKEEKEAADKKAKEEKEAVEKKAKEEKEAADKKAKEEKEAAEKKAKEEKEAADKKAKEEKETAEKKAKEEKEATEKKEKEVADKKAKEKKEKKEKEAAEKKVKEEKEAAEKKAKEEKEAAEKKAKEEKEAAEKKAKEEKEAAEKKAKEEKEVAEKKEKEAADKKIKEKKEKKEKEAAEKKAKEEKEAADKKAKDEKEAADKKIKEEKEAAEKKAKEEKELVEKKAKDKKDKKEKEAADKKAVEEKEAAAKKSVEEKEAAAKKSVEEKEAADKKSVEEKEAAEKKAKEEKEAGERKDSKAKDNEGDAAVKKDSRKGSKDDAPKKRSSLAADDENNASKDKDEESQGIARDGETRKSKKSSKTADSADGEDAEKKSTKKTKDGSVKKLSKKKESEKKADETSADGAKEPQSEVQTEKELAVASSEGVDKLLQSTETVRRTRPSKSVSESEELQISIDDSRNESLHTVESARDRKPSPCITEGEVDEIPDKSIGHDIKLDKSENEHSDYASRRRKRYSTETESLDASHTTASRRYLRCDESDVDSRSDRSRSPSYYKYENVSGVDYSVRRDTGISSASSNFSYHREYRDTTSYRSAESHQRLFDESSSHSRWDKSSRVRNLAGVHERDYSDRGYTPRDFRSHHEDFRSHHEDSRGGPRSNIPKWETRSSFGFDDASFDSNFQSWKHNVESTGHGHGHALKARDYMKSLGYYSAIEEHDHSLAGVDDLPVDGSHRYSALSRRRPRFTIRLLDRVVSTGSVLSMNCSATGTPLPCLEWFRNGYPVIPDSKVKIIGGVGFGSIEIHGVDKSDQSEYSCIATNSFGRARTSSTIHVIDLNPTRAVTKPVLFYSQMITETRTTNEIVLETYVKGHEDVYWMKDDKPISGPNYISHNLPDGRCKLTIRHPKKSDSGNWSCTGRNYFGVNSLSKFISIDDFSITGFKLPVFIKHLHDLNVEIGDSIFLSVTVEGADTVEFFKGGRAIETRLNRVGCYSTFIPFVQLQDLGVYVAVARNRHGHVESCCSLRCIASHASILPSFSVKPKPVYVVDVGVDLNIVVQVEGEPTPFVNWYKGCRNMILENPRAFRETLSPCSIRFTLKRLNLCDAGLYTLKAKNLIGEDVTQFYVQVRETRARSLTPVSSLAEGRSSLPNRNRHWASVERLARSYRHSSLQSQAYSSAFSRERTTPGMIQEQGVAVQEILPGWVSIHWNRIRGRIAGYYVHCKDLSDADSGWIELGFTRLCSHEANLLPGREYVFRITPKCKSIEDEFSLSSEPFFLSNRVVPEFTQLLPVSTAGLVGTLYKLRCQLREGVPCSITWSKDGEALDSSQNCYKTSFHNHIAELEFEVNEEDSGRFCCEAKNNHGRTVSYSHFESTINPENVIPCNLENIESPVILMEPKNRVVKNGCNAIVSCQVAPEKCDVQWIFNGKAVHEDDDSYKLTNNGRFFSLEVNSVNQKLSGQYTLVVSNPGGKCTSQFSIHCVDDDWDAKPKFLNQAYTDLQITSGDKFTLHGFVLGSGILFYVWRKDGRIIHRNRYKSYITEHERDHASLTVKQSAPEHSGTYECTVYNAYGQDKIKFNVAVKECCLNSGAKKNYAKKLLFRRRPEEMEIEEGDSTVLEYECEGDTDDDVHFKWYKDGLNVKDLKDAPHFTTENIGSLYKLYIQDSKMQFSGAYKLVVRSGPSSITGIVSVQVRCKSSFSPVTSLLCLSATKPLITKDIGKVECEPNEQAELRVEFKPNSNVFYVHWDVEGIVTTGNNFSTIVIPFVEGNMAVSARIFNSVGFALSQGSVSIPAGRLGFRNIPYGGRTLTNLAGKKHPQFYTHLHDKSVRSSDHTTVLQVSIKCNNLTRTKWFKDNNELCNSNKYIVREEGDLKSLEIRNLSLFDCGIYSVNIENRAGSDASSCYLHVT